MATQFSRYGLSCHRAVRLPTVVPLYGVYMVLPWRASAAVPALQVAQT